jgi:putative ABC transport system permease protein
MTKSISAAVHAVDPDIGLANPRTMEQVRDDSLASDSSNTILFASFAGIALFLAGVGIYGVMAFSVAPALKGNCHPHRTWSQPESYDWLRCMRRDATGLRGLALGLFGAYFVGRVMHDILFGVGTMDFSAFGASGADSAAHCSARVSATRPPCRIRRTHASPAS